MLKTLLLPFLCLLLLACGGGGGGDTAATRSFSVGGNIEGLDGTLVLSLNGAEKTLDSAGLFTFDNTVNDGAEYTASIVSDPDDQLCNFTSTYTGAISNGDVSQLSIQCDHIDPSLEKIVVDVPLALADERLYVISPSGSYEVNQQRLAIEAPSGLVSLTTEDDSPIYYTLEGQQGGVSLNALNTAATASVLATLMLNPAMMSENENLLPLFEYAKSTSEVFLLGNEIARQVESNGTYSLEGSTLQPLLLNATRVLSNYTAVEPILRTNGQDIANRNEMAYSGENRPDSNVSLESFPASNLVHVKNNNKYRYIEFVSDGGAIDILKPGASKYISSTIAPNSEQDYYAYGPGNIRTDLPNDIIDIESNPHYNRALMLSGISVVLKPVEKLIPGGHCLISYFTGVGIDLIIADTSSQLAALSRTAAQSDTNLNRFIKALSDAASENLVKYIIDGAACAATMAVESNVKAITVTVKALKRIVSAAITEKSKLDSLTDFVAITGLTSEILNSRAVEHWAATNQLSITLQVDNTTGTAPFSVRFVASCFDGKGEEFLCPEMTWNFGDGSQLTANMPTHVFETAKEYLVTANAEDLDGAEASAEIVIDVTDVDVTPPTIELISPAESALLNGIVTLTANASDNVGIKEVSFSYVGDGKVLIGTVSEPPYQVTWDTTGVSDRSYFLSTTAIDTSDNPSTDLVPVSIKNEEPPSDVDSDGVIDTEDNCPADVNGDQSDIDNDGLGDACDVFTDVDKDEIEDNEDNCPEDSNNDQADKDGDGIGDVCDEVDNEVGVWQVEAIATDCSGIPDGFKATRSSISRSFLVSSAGTEAMIGSYEGSVRYSGMCVSRSGDVKQGSSFSITSPFEVRAYESAGANEPIEAFDIEQIGFNFDGELGGSVNAQTQVKVEPIDQYKSYPQSIETLTCKGTWVGKFYPGRALEPCYQAPWK